MGTYGLRVPASRVGYVPDAQGGLSPGPRVLYVLGTRSSLGRTASLAVPRTLAPRRHPRLRRERVRLRVGDAVRVKYNLDVDEDGQTPSIIGLDIDE